MKVKPQGNNTNRIFSGAPWEKDYGYCRALQRGNFLFISGTVDLSAKESPTPKSAGEQATAIFGQIERLLFNHGLSKFDIVRTRMYILNRSDSEPVGLAHGKFFKDCEPATSMIIVSGFIEEAYKVEIEFQAYLPS